jgi:hypothetical protein
LLTNKVTFPLFRILPLIGVPPAAKIWFCKVYIIGRPSYFGIEYIVLEFLNTMATSGEPYLD